MQAPATERHFGTVHLWEFHEGHGFFGYILPDDPKKCGHLLAISSERHGRPKIASGGRVSFQLCRSAGGILAANVKRAKDSAKHPLPPSRKGTGMVVELQTEQHFGWIQLVNSTRAFFHFSWLRTPRSPPPIGTLVKCRLLQTHGTLNAYNLTWDPVPRSQRITLPPGPQSVPLEPIASKEDHRIPDVAISEPLDLAKTTRIPVPSLEEHKRLLHETKELRRKLKLQKRQAAKEREQASKVPSPATTSAAPNVDVHAPVPVQPPAPLDVPPAEAPLPEAKTPVVETPVSQPSPEADERYVFRQEGDIWDIMFEGKRLKPIKNSKGLKCIAILLLNKGRPMDVSELHRRLNPAPPINFPTEEPSEQNHDEEADRRSREFAEPGVNVDARADPKAIKKVREARKNLAEDLKAGKDTFSEDEIEELKDQIAKLDKWLSANTSLRGKPRMEHGPDEQIRLNICKNIATAVEKIREKSGPLAEHFRGKKENRGGKKPAFEGFIRTGWQCVYSPKDSIEWSVAIGD